MNKIECFIYEFKSMIHKRMDDIMSTIKVGQKEQIEFRQVVIGFINWYNDGSLKRLYNDFLIGRTYLGIKFKFNI